MTAEAAFVVVCVLSAAFGLAYFPLMNRVAKGFVSPYAKADIRKRIAAATIDGALVVSCVAGYRMHGSPLFLLAAAIYLLLRDALFVPGHSIGKYLLGLVVIDLDTGRPCDRIASARRNVILVIPGLNVVAICLEALAVLRDPQGQRLGDRMANTHVVEGLGAKDLVKDLQQVMWDLEMGRNREKQPVSETPLGLQIGPQFSNVEGCAEISRPSPTSRRPRPKRRSARRPSSLSESSAA